MFYKILSLKTFKKQFCYLVIQFLSHFQTTLLDIFFCCRPRSMINLSQKLSWQLLLLHINWKVCICVKQDVRLIFPEAFRLLLRQDYAHRIFPYNLPQFMAEVAGDFLFRFPTRTHSIFQSDIMNGIKRKPALWGASFDDKRHNLFGRPID